MRRLDRSILALAVALAATACVGPSRQHVIALNQKIATRSWDAALEQIDAGKEQQYGEANAVLYWLDRGAVLHDAGKLKESDEYLDLAERRMEELYTRSVSKAAASFLVNDNSEHYAGQVHERTLLHVLRALNYAYLGDRDEATVEARKVTAFLTEVNDRLGDRPLAYRDDAFAQYLSGLLFEDQGRVDDARICFESSAAAYRGYAQAFGVPDPQVGVLDGGRGSASALASSSPGPVASLAPAAAEPRSGAEAAPAPAPAPAVAEAAIAGSLVTPASYSPGTAAVPTALEAAAQPALAPDAGPAEPARAAAANGGAGELVFLHYNGPAPRRETATFQIAWNDAMVLVQESREAEEDTKVKNAIVAGIAGNAVTVAYPTFVQDPFLIHGSEIEVGSARAPTHLMEDVTAIARSTLDAALPAIKAKAIVRATIKFLVAKLAEEETKKQLGSGWGALAGLAGRVAAAASEVADTRGWAALPAQFRLARVRLAAGRHSVRVRYLGADGTVVSEETLEGIEIKDGGRTYVHVRTAS